MLNKNFFIRGSKIFSLTKIFVIFFILVSLVHYFIFTIFIVDGISMNPALKTGEYLLVARYPYLYSDPSRGDIIIMKFPGDPARKAYVKRIIGMPGEKISILDGKIFINGQRLKEKYIDDSILTTPPLERELKNNEYYVMGDNRPNSSDSRTWGMLPEKDIIGKANLVFLPFKNFRALISGVFILK